MKITHHCTYRLDVSCIDTFNEQQLLKFDDLKDIWIDYIIKTSGFSHASR